MERLQILWVAKGYTLPDSGVKSHTHPYYHMFHITKGTCHMIVDDVTYNLQPGQSLLVPRQVEHAFSNKESGTMEYLEIKFSLPQNGLDARLLQAGALISDSPLVGNLAQQVVKEYSDLGNLAEDAAGTYMMALLNALTASERYSKPRQFRFVDGSTYSQLSQQIIRYLEAHYAEDVSLDDLAAFMDYNKSYLCVAFKKDTHFTILDCLNTIRVRRAAELIVYSDHTLAQVAEHCGFASVSHFNRVFLKYVGATPGQCRRSFPVDTYFEKQPENAPSGADQPTRFLYSVLAQKRITPEMRQKLTAFEKEHGPDQ